MQKYRRVSKVLINIELIAWSGIDNLSDSVSISSIVEYCVHKSVLVASGAWTHGLYLGNSEKVGSLCSTHWYSNKQQPQSKSRTPGKWRRWELPTRGWVKEIQRKIFDSLWSPLARRLSCEVVSLTIKGNRQQSHSRPHSEYLINYFALGFDPTRKAEIAKRREDEIREPIPAKRYAKCHSEEGIARHFPRIVTAIHQFRWAERKFRKTHRSWTCSWLTWCRVVVNAVTPRTPGQISSWGTTTMARNSPARQNPMKNVEKVMRNWNPHPAL